MLISRVLFVGFVTTNVVLLLSPGFSRPPNQLVCGISLIGIENFSKPNVVELTFSIEFLRMDSMFRDVSELCTINVPA